jgi:hypothetical protein
MVAGFYPFAVYRQTTGLPVPLMIPFGGRFNTKTIVRNYFMQGQIVFANQPSWIGLNHSRGPGG